MPNNRKRVIGQVVSNSMDKTVVVEVEHAQRHPLYEKVIRTTKRYKAHDETNECQLGDVVVIVESRPISKTKRWAVQEVVREDLSARTTEVEDLAAVLDDVDADDAGDAAEVVAEVEGDVDVVEDGE